MGRDRERTDEVSIELVDLSPGKLEDAIRLKRESDFKATGNLTGGKTESYQAKDKHGILYQIKFTGKRQAARRLTGYQDDSSDIIGETIASIIVAPAFNSDGLELTPQVELILGGKKEDEFCMASKYLNSGQEGNIVMTLDDILIAIGGVKDKKSGHCQIDFSPTSQTSNGSIITPGLVYKFRNRKGEEFTVSIPKADIIDTILGSLIIGDHDVNPGNVMLIYNKTLNLSRAGRIDFGHAFNNLIKSWFGLGADGTPQIPKDRGCILDALNRESINGINQPTKFRRDYRGVLLDDQFIAKMQNADEKSPRYIDGINQAVSELTKMANEIKHDAKLLEEFKKSIASIAARSGHPIKEYKNMDITQVIASFKVTMLLFITHNIEETKSVGNILRVQKEIDDYLYRKKEPSFAELQRIFEADDMYLKGKNFHDKVEWVRPDGDSTLVKGSLKEYIEHRAKFLGINPKAILAKLHEYNKENAPTVDSARISKAANAQGFEPGKSMRSAHQTSAVTQGIGGRS